LAATARKALLRETQLFERRASLDRRGFCRGYDRFPQEIAGFIADHLSGAAK